MDTTRIHRLLRLIILLQRGEPVDMFTLVDELGVSRRTVFRDLKQLEAAGVPFFHERGQGYRIGSGFFLPPVSLTVPEALGLMLLGKQASGQRDRPLSEPALSAIYKLMSMVPEPIREACGDMMAHVTVASTPQPDTDAEAKHYHVLQRGMDERRAVTVHYKPRHEGEIEVYAFRPYAMHFAAQAWYALGYTDVHREVRVIKLLRIVACQLTSKRFNRPRDFTIASKLGNAWQLIPGGKEYAVELIFERQVATNVSEVLWHRSQQTEALPDGRVRMSFVVDGIEEISWWVCRYAGQVRVVKPKALREKVAQMHRHAAEMLSE